MIPLHFREQAEKLVAAIHYKKVGTMDVAAGLYCLYYAGVIDSGLYSEKTKTEAYELIKTVYKLD